MAASASDKARKSYSYLQKTLNSTISDVATSLTPNNVTNIPTDTGVSFVVDRVDSNGVKTPSLRELMTGVVSGSNLVNLVRGEQGTTAQQHLGNAVIEFVNSGEMWNDLIDFLLQDHSNPSGNHKSLTDDNGNEWLERISTASAVNQVGVRNAATGNDVSVEARGDDTNAGMFFLPKGTGKIYAKQRADGWVVLTDSWSYSAWDSTYKIGQITVPSDATTKLGKGMRVCITQSTGGTKYGIIVDLTATLLYVYFGTDYTLNNEAISSPAYSNLKVPYGFPADPTKWRVEVTDTTTRQQASPANGTWYNLGTVSINIPRGLWRVKYQVHTMIDNASTAAVASTTLSTANNSESDVDFTTHVRGNALIEVGATMMREKILSLAANTPYYLNSASETASASNIYNINAESKLFIHAECVYL